MAFIDSIKKHPIAFNKKYVEKILLAIINSNELNNSTLQQVISSKRNDFNPSEEETNNNSHAINRFVALSIAENDKKHAYELAKIDENDNSEDFNENTFTDLFINNTPVAENSEMWTRVVNFLDNTFLLIDNYTFDNKGNIKRADLIFDSSVLFPNIEEFQEQDSMEHEFVVNADPGIYMEVFKDIYSELVKNRIPFIIQLRDLPDMKYGFGNPFRLYISTKNLNEVANIVDNVTKKYKRYILPPNDILYLACNKTFGYTSVMPYTAYDESIDSKYAYKNKKFKTPMDIILDRVEVFINEQISGVNTDDWQERARKLAEYYQNRSKSGRYQKFIMDLDSRLMYANDSTDLYDGLDFENIYVLVGSLPKEVEENKTPEAQPDEVDEYADMYAPLTTTEVGKVDNWEIKKIFKEKEKEESQPIQHFFPEKKEEPIIINDIFGDRGGPILSTDINKKEIPKEEPQREIVKLFNDDDKPVLSNTGMYDNTKIIIEAVKNDDVKDADESELTEEATEYEQYSLDIVEKDGKGNRIGRDYSALFPRTNTSDESFNTIVSIKVDEQGRYTQLIRFLKAQNVESLFDKKIILKTDISSGGGNEITGIEYIRSVVIPMLIEKHNEQLYTLEKINDIYVDQIVDLDMSNGKVFKKRSLLGGLFSKKK